MSVVQLQDFNVATIYTVDFQTSLDFYTQVLGLKKGKGMGDGILLAGPGDLTIYLEGGRRELALDGEKDPCVCLCFSTSEGLKASHENLKKAGVRMVGEYLEFAPEFHMFRIADPGGNIIEFAGKP